MLNPWFLLGSIAFVASFSISLLMNHDWVSAIVAGSTGLVTAWGTAATVNWYRNHSTDSRVTALKYQIRTLQHHRATEQQGLLELEAEKERVARSLAWMQDDLEQRRTEISSAKKVSWNLIAPEMVESPLYPPSEALAIAAPTAAEVDLRQFLSETAATKQKVTASLNNLQAELSQLNAQTTENRLFRDQLVQEINHLSQQQQVLVANTKQLQTDVKDLEQCRNELDQYIAYVELKKQELETGANPLQKALKQLQTQVAALQTELQQLETQVSDRLHEKKSLDQTAQVAQEALQKIEQQLGDRHQEKESLEKQIDQLQTQKTTLQTSPALQTSLVQPDLSLAKDIAVKNTTPKSNPKKLISPSKPRSPKTGNGANTPSKPAVSSNPSKSASLQEGKNIEEALPDPWTNFMIQLSDYEFQALKAIAQESNPLRTLNTIAEDSFSSVDELLESINRQAQDIVGKSVINSRAGFAPPAIAREHEKTIKKMIETYEYLTE